MAVRPEAYMKQGMNRRKVGEDFYFLNKINALRKFFGVSIDGCLPSSPAIPKSALWHRSGCFEKHATVPNHHLCLEFLSRNQSHFGLPPATKSLESAKRKILAT